jgi:beta-1,2-mannobiose phosphorylase / 1,2-beta-oligomannan phosphorylase
VRSYDVRATHDVTLERSGALADMYTLSPYVWREQGGGYHVLLRGVNHSSDPAEKVSRVYYGRSGDGLHFTMEKQPVLAPGPGPEDANGCEDPTVVESGEEYVVVYSGWNQARMEGQLLCATGTEIHQLKKRGVVLPYTQRLQNPKEAALTPCPDGTWRLFFEYSRDGASRIGCASGPSLHGPWTVDDDPLTARTGMWDSWHLSPGPVLPSTSSETILIYNGATQEGVWRIGWIRFDSTVSRVIDRCDEPLLIPPPPRPGMRDVAFAASAVEHNTDIWLYYSVADKDLYRATLVEKW